MLKIIVIFIFSLINSVFCCTGCLDLDELSFSKTVQKFKTALVKFDVAFPYCKIHEAYTQFSQEINNKSLHGYNHPDVLIATIGVKDYGDNENKKIADRYKIKAEEFPVIKLFIDGNLDKAIHFDKEKEEVTPARLFLFLKEHSTAFIQAPGCLRNLDELSEKFMSQKGRRPDILKEAEQIIENIDCEKKKNLAKFYAASMKGIMEHGDDFVVNQQERMKKLLKDKLSAKKSEELTKKLNILSSFKIKKVSRDEF